MKPSDSNRAPRGARGHDRGPIRSPSLRLRHIRRLALLVALGLAGLARPLSAQAEDTGIDPDDLRRMSLEELMDMDVTSVSRAPEPYAEAAAAIQVITQQQIRRSGASNIAEALRLATNLHVAQKNSHSWAVSARGFNADLANKLLVLIDGRTVYTPLFSGVFWDRQDYVMEDIDRIEVISGPGGTLWGANAVNGVINIITKRAQDSQGLYADATAGPGWGRVAGARFGGSLNSRVSYRVFGKHSERDSEVLPNGADGSDAWNRLHLGFRSDVAVTERDELTVQGGLYDSKQGVPGGRSDSDGANVLGRWAHTFSADSDLRFQLYFDHTHLRLPTAELILNGASLAPAGALEDDLDTYDVDLQHRFGLGARNRVVWGMAYRLSRNEVASAPSLAFDPPKLDRTLVSGFVQNELAVTPDLGLTVGTKVEHNDYTGFELEPSARLSWSVAGTAQTLWAAASRAVRMPSRVDRHERLPTPGFAPIVENLLVGNETFRSETVLAFELGYRARIGSNVAASVSTFYKDYDDLRSTSTSPPDPVFQLPFPFFFANDLEATTYGAELVADVVLTEAWSLRGGYTLLQQDIEVAPGGMDFNNALNETADPEHQLSFYSSMDLPQDVELDLGLRWIGSFQYNNSGVPETVPSYTEADARLAWHPTQSVELSVEGHGLLHDHHLEYVSSGPNPGEEIERSVRAGLTIRW